MCGAFGIDDDYDDENDARWNKIRIEIEIEINATNITGCVQSTIARQTFQFSTRTAHSRHNNNNNIYSKCYKTVRWYKMCGNEFYFQSFIKLLYRMARVVCCMPTCQLANEDACDIQFHTLLSKYVKLFAVIFAAAVVMWLKVLVNMCVCVCIVCE